MSESKAKKAQTSAKGKFICANNSRNHALKENAPTKTVCNRFKEFPKPRKEVKANMRNILMN